METERERQEREDKVRRAMRERPYRVRGPVDGLSYAMGNGAFRLKCGGGYRLVRKPKRDDD